MLAVAGRARRPVATEARMLEVLAEMVASVWKVEAHVGQSVVEGDTLVILESMKMEIPVFAPSDGVVSEIRVREGDKVQEGDVLAIVARP